MSQVIAAEGIGVRCGSAQILDNVSLRVAAGAFVAIAGPNGAGKTTLLRAIAGMLPNRAGWSMSGAVTLAGKPLARMRRRDIARVVAYVPQAVDPAIPYTVAEFMEMARYAHLRAFAGLAAADRDAIARALAQTGTADFERRPMSSLSGGEMRRVLVAGALAQEPRALLLDEPAAFLDVRHEVELERLLRKVCAETGTAVVCVTHEINGAIATASHVLALRNGATAFDGTAAAFADAATLEAVFGHRFRVLPAEGGRTAAVLPERP